MKAAEDSFAEDIGQKIGEIKLTLKNFNYYVHSADFLVDFNL